jgi:hypothetical protein
LQAGTPLAPQQIRDAWPGRLSPYIERLGGKFNVSPTVPLLSLIDGRGDRSATDEDSDAGRRDNHVVKRQVCAQLLLIFLRREENLKDIPSIGSRQLDLFYYVDSAFPTESQLHLAGRIVHGALSRLQNRKVLPKLEVFSLFMFLQEARKHYELEFDQGFLWRLTEFVAKYEDDFAGPRTKSSTISGHYDRWLRALAAMIDGPETRFIKEREASGFLDPELESQFGAFA